MSRASPRRHTVHTRHPRYYVSQYPRGSKLVLEQESKPSYVLSIDDRSEARADFEELRAHIKTAYEHGDVLELNRMLRFVKRAEAKARSQGNEEVSRYYRGVIDGLEIGISKAKEERRARKRSIARPEITSLKLGDKIIPTAGAYKGKIFTIKDIKKAKHSLEGWSHKGQNLYFATEHGEVVGLWLRRQDFKPARGSDIFGGFDAVKEAKKMGFKVEYYPDAKNPIYVTIRRGEHPEYYIHLGHEDGYFVDSSIGGEPLKRTDSLTREQAERLMISVLAGRDIGVAISLSLIHI